MFMKALRYILAFALCVLASSFALGQGSVQTNIEPKLIDLKPSYRNAYVEEYTGIKCGYCPSGQRYMNNVVKDNLGRVFLNNLAPTGNLTSDDGIPGHLNFTSQETQKIQMVLYSGGTLPSITINRIDKKLSPYDFYSVGRAVMEQISYANLGAKIYLDTNTREALAEVEVYYTSAPDSVESNSICINIVQDSILSYQYGQSGNPDCIDPVSGDYWHNHHFRGFFTQNDVNGEGIKKAEKNLFLRKYIKGKLNETYGNGNIELVLRHTSFLVLLQRNKYDIVTVVEPEIVYGSLPTNYADAEAYLIYEGEDEDGGDEGGSGDEPGGEEGGESGGDQPGDGGNTGSGEEGEDIGSGDTPSGGDTPGDGGNEGGDQPGEDGKEEGGDNPSGGETGDNDNPGEGDITGGDTPSEGDKDPSEGGDEPGKDPESGDNVGVSQNLVQTEKTKIYSRDKTIYIEGLSNNGSNSYIRLYNSMGSLEKQIAKTSSSITIKLNNIGLYLLEIDNITHKVLVK